MKRETNLIIHVPADKMEDPVVLFDATIAHFILKKVQIHIRRKFIMQYMKAHQPAKQLAVIRAWVQVRDIAKFQFKHSPKEAVDVASGTPEGAGESETGDGATTDTTEGVEGENGASTEKEESDADKTASGEVSMDDGADGESESGTTSE